MREGQEVPVYPRDLEEAWPALGLPTALSVSGLGPTLLATRLRIWSR